jgi:hypothetical protein
MLHSSEFSKVFVPLYLTTWYHIPEDCNHYILHSTALQTVLSLRDIFKAPGIIRKVQIFNNSCVLDFDMARVQQLVTLD